MQDMKNEQDIENNKKTKKSHWIYPDISEIEKNARENKNPYKVTVLVLIALGLLAQIFLLGLTSLLLELIIILPILYLICRNYRLGYYLMIVYYTLGKFISIFDIISTKGSIPSSVWSGIIFWLIMVASCISAIRLIAAKKRLGLTHKKNIAVDIIIAIFLPIFMIILFLFLNPNRLALEPHSAIQPIQKYEKIDLGWGQTSLPFSLNEDISKELQMKNAINNEANSPIIQNMKIYTGTYNGNDFYLGISNSSYKPSFSLDMDNGFIGTITGAGIEPQIAEQALKHANKTEENGIIKYSYTSEAKIKNIPAVFGIVTCKKENNIIVLWGFGINNSLNKAILTTAVNETICFPNAK